MPSSAIYVMNQVHKMKCKVCWRNQHSPKSRLITITFLFSLSLLQDSTCFRPFQPRTDTRISSDHNQILALPKLLKSRNVHHRFQHKYYSDTSRQLAPDSSAGSPVPFFPSEEESSSASPQPPPSSVFSEKQQQKQSGLESSSSSKSFREVLDELGSSLKPKAVQASAKAGSVSVKWRQYVYLAKACLLYSLFIVYRGYRGFFVILPAVFRETFRKLEAAVNDAPFDDDKVDGLLATTIENQASKNTLWKTRVTVGVLSFIVTVSYVIGGVVRIIVKMFRTLRANNWNIVRSFAAAADEQEKNEQKLFKNVVEKSNEEKKSSI